MDEQEAAVTAPRRGETYRGRSRQERAADRREPILASALRLFAARDVDDVTIADVCAQPKVSKRNFYDYFADRGELLLAVHRVQNTWLMDGIAAAVPKHPDNVEHVFRCAMSTMVQMLLEHPDRGRVIYINAPRMEPRRRGLLRKDAEQFGRLVCRANGKPKDKVRFDRLLLALVAGVTEVVIDWLFGGMTDPPEALVDHLSTLGMSMLHDL